ncbi:C40 family peptidase [Bordetella sp. 02P26C-1]|uniref:C40 family peptidase n=1 Tax=Bordetella sp. 02P26C-1 TaxID=2683195 RepID=UPI001353FBC4|nr:C40 family peptidase [Bordetella sp. 02P26C-1]MVW80563.1 NlpC/P60 family protein 2 [Bordetella sp. 02P26C-1]
MTPPTRKARTARSLFTAFFSAPLLALGLSCSLPAHATIMAEAIPSVQGLRMVDALTVPSLPEMVVQAGLEAIGTPYVWGGEDPDAGFDCSGLTQFVYREIVGVELPRTAREQRRKGTGVSKKELKPGDLVFFSTTRRRGVSHVGIYIGQNQFVHAPTRGSTVRIDSLDNKYWSRHYVAARRYIEAPAETPMPEVRMIAQADHQ